MSNNGAWNQREEWIRDKMDKHFRVVIKHWTREGMPGEGANHWNVYGFIFIQHPLFSKIESDSTSQEALYNAPMHGGVTYLRRHASVGEPVHCIEFGSDYGHLYDERFSFMKTLADAREVEEDANALFAWLSAMVKDEDRDVRRDGMQ